MSLHRIWAQEDPRHPAAELPTAQDAAQFVAVLRAEFPARKYRTDEERAQHLPYRSGQDLAPVDGPEPDPAPDPDAPPQS